MSADEVSDELAGIVAEIQLQEMQSVADLLRQYDSEDDT